MQTSLSSKGHIVLPAELRQRDHLRPGQKFEVEWLQAGEYPLKKVADGMKPSLVKWLSACPEKNWFQPLPADSTADS